MAARKKSGTRKGQGSHSKRDPLPQAKAAATPAKSKALNPRQQRFIDAYVLEPNATKAAITAGYSTRTATQIGFRLLTFVHVRQAVDTRLKEIHDAFEIDQIEVLRAYHAVAFTDANQLVQHRRHCCRFCYGVDMKYQLTPNEARAHDRIIIAREEATAAADTERLLRLEMPEEWVDNGGSGYDRRRDPNPDCCECFGDGLGYVFIADTRKLSAEARHLFAGIEETKDGMKVRMKSADKAMDMLARHKQLLVERIEVDLRSVPTEKLDALHDKAMADAAAKQATVRGRMQRLGLTLDSRAELP